MAGVLCTFTGLLLLLSFDNTGVNGRNNQRFAGIGYDVILPADCNFSECNVRWQFNRSTKRIIIANIQNGVIKRDDSKGQRLRVLVLQNALQIRNVTAEDVGIYRFRRRGDFNFLSLLKVYSSSPESNMVPGQTVSLHCALLTYGNRCADLSLKWVDEAGAEIEDDGRHQIEGRSRCSIGLSVTIQDDDNNRIFRCNVIRNRVDRFSVEFPIRFPEWRLMGRGGNQEVIGTAVGVVVVCVMLTIVVAVFAVSRRRANSQVSGHPGNITRVANDMDTDDITYADISVPAGHRRGKDDQPETTEYTTIRTAT